METLIDPTKLRHSLAVMECLASPNRFEMIRLLTAHGEMNVKEMTRLARINKPVAVRHLHKLHKVGFIKRRRKGKSIYYSLIMPRVEMVVNVADILAD